MQCFAFMYVIVSVYVNYRTIWRNSCSLCHYFSGIFNWLSRARFCL